MRKKKRMKGIVGIEAAIVLIAFVIVAAALAFVVLNMGMFTTQRSKEVIGRGLSEASSAIEVDGIVTGNVTNNKVGALLIPLKVAPGREAVDLDPSKLAVKLVINSGAQGGVAYEDVYIDAVPPNQVTGTDINTLLGYVTQNGTAKIIIIQGDNDKVLEFGEKAILVIRMPTGKYLDTYDEVMVEIKPVEGAPLTVERTVPPSLPESGAVSLG